ncbi:MAG: molybdopterin-guanine dinucleotide biosynthesis protein B [Rhodospirillaceae bacterium]|nr:MAG: molybdopterin-guanine dinucleotide biosynthesis protein B [Rhodospirillaceae bacterium]
MKQKVMGIMGRSGSGKTTLLSDLIPVLIEMGFSVSTVKHTHHHFDVDKPGKDSYRHREAGAKEVLLTSSQRWALLHEVRDEPEPDMVEMMAHMSPVDVVLIEGFKSHDFPKIEVYRPSLGKPIIGRTKQNVVAIVTDEADHQAVTDLNIEILDLGDIKAIGAFIVEYLKLKASK